MAQSRLSEIKTPMIQSSSGWRDVLVATFGVLSRSATPSEPIRWDCGVWYRLPFSLLMATRPERRTARADIALDFDLPVRFSLCRRSPFFGLRVNGIRVGRRLKSASPRIGRHGSLRNSLPRGYAEPLPQPLRAGLSKPRRLLAFNPKCIQVAVECADVDPSVGD